MATKTLVDPRQAAVDFSGRLREVHGADLVSAVLYGSVARGEYRPGVSDINLLVLLRHLDVDRLRRGASITRDWLEAGNPPPLMMTLDEWSSSADVFPIEYTDIRGAHEILHGDDPFVGVQIHREHLRLQLEHELRTRKIQLREAILSLSDRPEELGSVICRSIPSLGTLFRAMLRLAGRAAPATSDPLISAVASEVGFDPDPVQRVLRCRDNGGGSSEAAQEPVLSGYLDAIDRTVRWLDRFPAGDATVLI